MARPLATLASRLLPLIRTVTIWLEAAAAPAERAQPEADNARRASLRERYPDAPEAWIALIAERLGNGAEVGGGEVAGAEVARADDSGVDFMVEGAVAARRVRLSVPRLRPPLAEPARDAAAAVARDGEVAPATGAAPRTRPVFFAAAGPASRPAPPFPTDPQLRSAAAPSWPAARPARLPRVGLTVRPRPVGAAPGTATVEHATRPVLRFLPAPSRRTRVATASAATEAAAQAAARPEFSPPPGQSATRRPEAPWPPPEQPAERQPTLMGTPAGAPCQHPTVKPHAREHHAREHLAPNWLPAPADARLARTVAGVAEATPCPPLYPSAPRDTAMARPAFVQTGTVDRWPELPAPRPPAARRGATERERFDRLIHDQVERAWNG